LTDGPSRTPSFKMNAHHKHSAVIPSDKTHNYSRWSYNVGSLKTLADKNKQNLGLTVFHECLYQVFAVISKIYYSP